MARENGYPTLKRVLREAGITGDEVREECGLKKLDTVYDRNNGVRGEWDIVDMMLIHLMIKQRTGVDWEIGKLFDLDEGDREDMKNMAEGTANAWNYLNQRWDIDLSWGF